MSPEQTTGCQTVGQFVSRAKKSLDPGVWHYAAGGAGEGVTLRRNRRAFRRLALQPSILKDVSIVEPATTFLGVPLSLPVMLAPVGSVGLFDSGGALAAARGASRAGTTAFIGTLSSPTLEEVSAGSDGPLFFQIYVQGDRGWLTALVRRAEEAGYRGLCITVDSTVPARRDRATENGFDWRLENAGSAPNLQTMGSDRRFQSRFDWKELAWLRQVTSLPLIVKGVTCADDARRLVDAGVDALYVSNHGGRALDHVPAALQLLDEIVTTVQPEVEVVVDGGFLYGTDVCKALCLGARAVLLGKLQCWALAVGGADGVCEMLSLLRQEVTTTMAHLGCVDVDALDRARLRPVWDRTL